MTTEKTMLEPRNTNAVRPTTRRGKAWLLGFHKDESGVMIVLSIYIVLIIYIVGGIGIDLMRFEMTRSRLQGTVDRAVLAAADLDQPLSPSAVVNDYFDKAGMSDYLSSVVVDQGLNYRTVTAKAGVVIHTNFMRMRGIDIDTLSVPAGATAEERMANVEISMVLDISGSMAYASADGGTKMSRLRDAAKVFVDTVVRPETEDLVSVSLIPYSQHVNAGPRIFKEYNMVGAQYTSILSGGSISGSQDPNNVGTVNATQAAKNKNKPHNWSHCVEMADTEFDVVPISMTKQYAQMQHFQWNYDGSNSLTDTICPRYNYERIRAFSQNKNQLNNQIDDLQPRAGTQIFMGMKWGAAMLDPAFQPVVNKHIAKGWSDAAFAGRPVAYNDPETLKTVILMTDGINSTAARITDEHYDTKSKRINWRDYNLNYFLSHYVNYNNRSEYYYQKYSAAQGDALLDNICDASKAAGIVIWSIGFEVDNHGADVMRNCASSPAHFFRVEGVEISEAFRAIARQINQLRLTN